MRKKTILLSLLSAGIFFLAPAHAADNAGTGEISSAVADAEVISCTVRPGHSLGKILRETGKIPEHLIFTPQTQTALQQANPQVRNFSRLQAGTELIIPVRRILEQIPVATQNRKRSSSEPKRQHEQIPPSSKAKNHSAGDPVWQEINPQLVACEQDDQNIREKLIFDRTGTAGQAKIHRLLSGLAYYFGGRDNTTCFKKLQVDSAGSCALDCMKNPLYEFPWGKTIILDYGSRIPASLQDIVRTSWPNASIVSVSETEDPVAVIDKAVAASGLQKLSSGSSYSISLNTTQIEIQGAAVVYHENNPRAKHILSLGPTARLPVSLKKILNSTGIQLVSLPDFALNREAQCPQPAFQDPGIPDNQSDPAALTDIILNHCGVYYQKNVKTKLVPRNESGITLEMISDRKFTRGGKTYFILFKGISENILHLFESQGYKVLRVDRTRPADIKLLESLVNFCGKGYAAPMVQIQYDLSERTWVKISIPGLMTRAAAGNVIFTKETLDQNVLKLLNALNVKVNYF